MRILIIDKTAVLESSHRRYEILSRYPGVELTVLSPRVWDEHMRLVPAERKSHPDYAIYLGKTFWTGSYSRGFYLSGLKQAICESKPDIIQLLEEPWSFFAGQTIHQVRKQGLDARVLFYTWENIYRPNTYCSKLDMIHRRIEAAVFAHCCSGICATELASSVLEKRGYKGDRKVIPYGIHERFLADSEVIEMRVQHPYPEEPSIGYAGRLLEMKGIDLLIQALVEIPGRLCILGSGDYEPKLRALAKAKGVETRIEWIPAIPPLEVPGWMSSLDCLVLPSRTTPVWAEQLGRVLIEAMGLGIPVVGSSSGSIPEVIGDDGWVFQENNVESLVTTLRAIQRDPTTRNDRIRSAWKKVSTKYTWQQFAESLYQHYRKILD